jgi:hypothetical protein
MTKTIKLVLIVSLLLNVCLVVGFVVCKKYVAAQCFELVACTGQAETKLLEGIVSDLESDDPAKITALKERLRKQLEIAREATEMWQQAAGKSCK